MRIHGGNYAYEVRKAYEPKSQILMGWEYSVFRIRPSEELLHSRCCSPTQEAAEREAQQILALLMEQEREHRAA